MQEGKVGLFITSCWSSAHADDIVTNSWNNINAFIQKVHSYASSNGLKLNVEKCEIFAVPRCKSSLNELRTEENKILIKGAIKKSEEHSLLLGAQAFLRTSSTLQHQENDVKCVCSLYSYTAVRIGFFTTNQ